MRDEACKLSTQLFRSASFPLTNGINNVCLSDDDDLYSSNRIGIGKIGFRRYIRSTKVNKVKSKWIQSPTRANWAGRSCKASEVILLSCSWLLVSSKWFLGKRTMDCRTSRLGQLTGRFHSKPTRMLHSIFYGSNYKIIYRSFEQIIKMGSWTFFPIYLWLCFGCGSSICLAVDERTSFVNLWVN